MGGIELRDDELIVERARNELDKLAVGFTAVLDDLGIQHVYVAGYVAILAGRSRATEDVDVLLERLDEPRTTRLVDRLEEEGMWGPAMPLENAITAHIAGAEIPIGPLELQIAYKLYLGSRKDFEDAVHLYTLFEESLRTGELERWVERLGVEADYERLKTA